MNAKVYLSSDSNQIISIEITNKTIERVLSFLIAHPERASSVSEKVNESIQDILTMEEYAVKVGLYWQERNSAT